MSKASIKTVPGPPPGFLAMKSAREFARDPLRFSQRMVQEYGSLVALRFGPVRAFIAADPEAVEQVLVSRAKSFRKERRTKRAVSKMAGNGIIASEGPFWLRQRRMMQQGFVPKRMAGYAEQIVSCASEMVTDWPPTATFDISAEMASLSMQIICRSMFQFTITGQQAHDWHEAAELLSESVLRELSTMINLPDWAPVPHKLRKRRARRTLEHGMRAIIAERRAIGEDRGDMLSALINAVDTEGDGTQMSDQQVLDECLTLLHAGYDSTAAGMTWCWYLLAQHPEIQQRAAAEVDHVLGSRSANYDDFEQLIYLRRIINETLRLYPPAWMMMLREAVVDTELVGYHVPQGSWIYLIPWATHRSERWFADPLKFDPDRFSPERAGEIPRHAYFPFGLGGHYCIGEKLAMIEMTLGVATVLQQYGVSLPPHHIPPKVEPHTAIRPTGGLPLQFEKRSKSA